MKPEDNPVFKEVANSIVGELPKSEQPELTILVILTIISISISLLRLIQGCRSKNSENYSELSELVDDKKNQAIIRKTVKKHLGPIQDLRHGPAITKAILSRASNMSEEDLVALLDNLDETEE